MDRQTEIEIRVESHILLMKQNKTWTQEKEDILRKTLKRNSK